MDDSKRVVVTGWGLDRAVSEATGVYPPSPSTDLNDAFAAAERVQLFGGEDMDCRWVLQKDYHGQTRRHFWIVCDNSWEVEILGKGDTAALAICSAILKFTEGEDVRPEADS